MFSVVRACETPDICLLCISCTRQVLLIDLQHSLPFMYESVNTVGKTEKSY